MGALAKFFAPALAALLIFGGCNPSKEIARNDGLQFVFPSSETFQVHQLREKRGQQVELLYDCKLVKSNGGFVLEWVNATIISIDKKSVRESRRSQLSSLEAMFRHPSFRIAGNGEFLETINAAQVMKQSNQHLDQIFSNRSESSRQLFDKLGEHKSGKKMLDDYYGQIWRTWVDLWIGVDLPAGQTFSFDSEAESLPGKGKISNLGPVSTNSQLVHLKYEEDVVVKDFGAGVNKVAEKVAKEIGLKKPESVLMDGEFRRITIFEVHADPKNLRPYWAKKTVTGTLTFPGKPEETQIEVNEYRFFWAEASHPKPNQ
jgi:hypothetical protein